MPHLLTPLSKRIADKILKKSFEKNIRELFTLELSGERTWGMEGDS